jgi:hypothetical protein
MLLKERFINRLNSDKADVTTTSILLWITFTVILFTVVGPILFDAVFQKGRSAKNCITNSTWLFNDGDTDCAMSNQPL